MSIYKITNNKSQFKLLIKKLGDDTKVVFDKQQDMFICNGYL